MANQLDAKIKQTIIEQYNRYYRLAFSYVHNENDALDIVQEGAYKAILYSKTLKKEEYMETWLYRIMIHEALSFIKKNKPNAELSDFIVEGKEDTYEDIDLKRALETLGEPEGTIIKLRFFEDMKLEQIASILNENVNTIKTKLYRTLKKLRVSMEMED